MTELPIAVLRDADPPDKFPDVSLAMTEPDGLLAVGGNLSLERLIAAYKRGIFPWYSEGEPVLWWAPEKRAVLYTDELNCSKSLRKTLRSGRFEVSGNQAFEQVIRACAELRLESGTWITQEMYEGYLELHAAGYAHSLETWRDGELVGGLYGVSLGQMFFGESMFSTVSDASKVALATLVDCCGQAGIPLIDCQQPSAHLSRLGMRLISREKFGDILAAYTGRDCDSSIWSFAPRPSRLPESAAS